MPYGSNLSEFVLHPSVSLCSAISSGSLTTSILLISKYLRPFSTQGVVKGHLFTQKLALNCSRVVLTKDPCRKTLAERPLLKVTLFDEMMDKAKNADGFLAALDQSGGSTPKALKAYGVPDDVSKLPILKENPGSSTH